MNCHGIDDVIETIFDHQIRNPYVHESRERADCKRIRYRYVRARRRTRDEPGEHAVNHSHRSNRGFVSVPIDRHRGCASHRRAKRGYDGDSRYYNQMIIRQSSHASTVKPVPTVPHKQPASDLKHWTLLWHRALRVIAPVLESPNTRANHIHRPQRRQAANHVHHPSSRVVERPDVENRAPTLARRIRPPRRRPRPVRDDRKYHPRHRRTHNRIRLKRKPFRHRTRYNRRARRRKRKREKRVRVRPRRRLNHA
mmetsp:Transcript_2765/g.9943  ORF Transcript_2765/g.9943 Transcript_2765/m.9943 type:complete len:253 (-) Transcript_2765:300-1058(-)